MSEKAELELVIKDSGSGNASKVKVSLEQVAEAGGHAEGSLLELNAGVELLSKAFDALKEVGESLLEVFEEFEGAAKVFQLKDGERGNEVLEEMLSRMKDVGIAASDAVVIAKKLGQEFDPRTAEQLSLVIADIRGNLRLTGAETRSLADEFVALGSRATVSSRQVRGLEHLFGGKDVVTEIARATGDSVAKVTAELKKGTLPTDQLVKGLRQAQLDLAGVSTVGGAAQKSAATSVEDQVGRLKNVVADFGETLAKDLFGGNDAAEGIKNFADQLKGFLESKDVQGFLKDLAAAMKSLGHVAGELVVPALHLMVSAFNGIKAAYSWLTGGTEGAKAALAALAGAGIGVLIVALVALVPPLVSAGIAMIAATWPALAIIAAFALVGLAIYELVAHWDGIKRAVSSFASTVWGFITGAWEGLVHALSRAGSAIVSGLSAAWDYVASLPGRMLQAGKDIVMGLVDGIVSLATKPIEAIKGIGTGIADAFKAVLGIHSPSLVMQAAGLNVAAGAEVGIERGTPGVEDASRQLAIASYGPMSRDDPGPTGGPPAGGQAQGRGDTTNYWDITVNAGPAPGAGGDDHASAIGAEVARAIRVELGRMQAQGNL